eukprot:238513-Rhodomonas_salina.3
MRQQPRSPRTVQSYIRIPQQDCGLWDRGAIITEGAGGKIVACCVVAAVRNFSFPLSEPCLRAQRWWHASPLPFPRLSTSRGTTFGVGSDERAHDVFSHRPQVLNRICHPRYDGHSTSKSHRRIRLSGTDCQEIALSCTKFGYRQRL